MLLHFVLTFHCKGMSFSFDLSLSNLRQKAFRWDILWHIRKAQCIPRQCSLFIRGSKTDHKANSIPYIPSDAPSLPPHLTPQTARLEHYDVHCKSFSWISHLRNLCSFGLVVDHFGASWKAVIARSLTFEPRQIEGWSWWQNWPISCAFQLCCWVGDLKTNSLGSRPASMKM